MPNAVDKIEATEEKQEWSGSGSQSEENEDFQEEPEKPLKDFKKAYLSLVPQLRDTEDNSRFMPQAAFDQ